jgi:glycosyltransferase involved in cell wall biosynthesis
MNIDVMPLGYISDEKKIVEAYNAADVFVLPSLEDNLPNTIMEAMACGTPCVGFDVGGIPEMIDHKKNGYVARYKDPDDLAEGIQWVVGHERYDSLSDAAVAKVAAEYSQSLVAKRYIDVYNDALKNTNYYDI